MKTVYYSEDGKKFNDKKSCIEYEEQLTAKEAEKLKKEQEKEARQKEVEDAYKNYKDLLNKFLNDYDSYSKAYINSDIDYPFLSYLAKVFDL